MSDPPQVMFLALVALWGAIIVGSGLARGYFDRDSPALRRLFGQPGKRRMGASGLVILTPFMVGLAILHGALLAILVSDEVLLGRLISAVEIFLAAGWIGYLARLPRSAAHKTISPPDREIGEPIDGHRTNGNLDKS